MRNVVAQCLQWGPVAPANRVPTETAGCRRCTVYVRWQRSAGRPSVRQPVRASLGVAGVRHAGRRRDPGVSVIGEGLDDHPPPPRADEPVEGSRCRIRGRFFLSVTPGAVCRCQPPSRCMVRPEWPWRGCADPRGLSDVRFRGFVAVRRLIPPACDTAARAGCVDRACSTVRYAQGAAEQALLA